LRAALARVSRRSACRPEFDPATSQRRFSLAISTQSILALSGVLRRVHELAPGVRLETWPITTT